MQILKIIFLDQNIPSNINTVFTQACIYFSDQFEVFSLFEASAKHSQSFVLIGFDDYTDLLWWNNINN